MAKAFRTARLNIAETTAAPRMSRLPSRTKALACPSVFTLVDDLLPNGQRSPAAAQDHIAAVWCNACQAPYFA
jgi:hypothetical protein